MPGRIKKACIVTLEYPPDQWGGLARTVERVARHISKMGIDVHVAHFLMTEEQEVLFDENREDIHADGAIIHRLKAGMEDLSGRQPAIWDSPFTRTFKMMYQSLELLHIEQNFDCLHSFFLYPTGFITGMVARKTKKPSILTIAGNDINKYIFSPYKTAMCRSGLDNADKVVALSQDLLNTADALSPVSDKGTVIFNSVNIPSKPWNTHDGNPFRIGCAGIFKYAKGLPYLFKAVAELMKLYNVRLELMGSVRDSEQKTFKIMVNKTGIADILTLHKAAPQEKVTEWLLSLDAFVLPSLSEGCPNILMEAMATGLPCVATRVGAVEYIMEDTKSGFTVPWGNSKAIAEGVERIIKLPDRGTSMGLAARERMNAFSWEREHKAWEQIYKELSL